MIDDDSPETTHAAVGRTARERGLLPIREYYYVGTESGYRLRIPGSAMHHPSDPTPDFENYESAEKFRQMVCEGYQAKLYVYRVDVFRV